MPKVTGIIAVGPFYSGTGYASVAINYVLGLNKISYPVRVINYGLYNKDIVGQEIYKKLKSLETANVGAYPVCIVWYQPTLYENIRIRGAVRKIGYTTLETDSIPAEWVYGCNLMDEVWVLSNANYRAFSKSGVEARKLRIVPHNIIDTSYFHPGIEPLPIEQKKGFTFLYVFTCDWRKKFNLLLEAYFTEFTNKDNVTLILKILPGYGAPSANVKERVLGSVRHKFDVNSPFLPNLIILDKMMSYDDLRRLYAACDLYISTDSASEVTMPVFEAIAMGKPAATVNWGCNDDFIFKGNPLTIQTTGKLVEVDENTARERPIYKGRRWEEAKVEDIRRVMRFAYSNRGELKSIAEREHEYVVKSCSLEVRARKIVNIIDSFDIDTTTSDLSPQVTINKPFFVERLLRLIRWRRRK